MARFALRRPPTGPSSPRNWPRPSPRSSPAITTRTLPGAESTASSWQCTQPARPPNPTERRREMPKEFKITKDVLLEATPEQVWQSIATEAGLSAWFQPAPVDPASEMVVAWEPGRHLAIRTPAADDGSMHAFEYLIEARGGGSTVLRFVHSGFAGDDWSDEYQPVTSGGWDMYLYTLA